MPPDGPLDRFTPQAMRTLIDQDADAWSELRADFEGWLGEALRRGGLDEARRCVVGLNEAGFDFAEVRATATTVGFSSPLPDVELSMEVEVSCSEYYTSAQVSFDSGEAQPAGDPRHERFYATYQEMLGLPESEIGGLDPIRRAVYLVGLMEAELNNGGFGQYLLNTEGALLEQTVEILEQIDAPEAHRLLAEVALLLNDSGVDPSDAWDDLGTRLEELDDQFLLAAEDLAGAVMDAADSFAS